MQGHYLHPKTTAESCFRCPQNSCSNKTAQFAIKGIECFPQTLIFNPYILSTLRCNLVYLI